MFKFPTKSKKRETPDNFLTKCGPCNQMIVTTTLNQNFNVCQSCGTNLKRSASEIIAQTFDENSFREKFRVFKYANPIDLEGYEDKQKQLRELTGLDEAVVCGRAKINGESLCIAIMDTSFIMGSLSSAVGDKLTLITEYATSKKLPLIFFTASGGARMQEGIISLMQMAKVTNALKVHNNRGLFYMPILMNPTTGGVSASFAQIGDVVIAEDRALICFAGPRVIKQTIKAELPDGFQTSEFLLEHGFLDKIVKRKDQRDFIYKMIILNRGV